LFLSFRSQRKSRISTSAQQHLAHPRPPPYQQTPAQLRYTYTAEFDFRYNTRKMTDAERMALSIHGIVGKRLTYRRTTSAAKAQA
jgi:hypothetical protein